jgi:hypothetical protein
MTSRRQPTRPRQPDTAPVERVRAATPRPPLCVVPAGSPVSRPPRPRLGAGSSSWEAEAGQQGCVLATTHETELNLGIVVTTAQALHDQIPVADILLLPPSLTPDEDGPTAVVLDVTANSSG